MAKIIKNSYWYVETDNIRVICEKCQEEKQIPAWFWLGETGYADDIINCHICGSIIKGDDKNENPPAV